MEKLKLLKGEVEKILQENHTSKENRLAFANGVIYALANVTTGLKGKERFARYLRQMPNEDPGSTYNMIGNVIFAFNCKWSQPTRSLNGRGSLLVCPGNSKSVSLRGSLYPVTKYWEKRSFFPRI